MLILATYWIGRRHMRLSRRGFLAIPLTVLLGFALQTLRNWWLPAADASIVTQIVAMLVCGAAAAAVYLGAAIALRLLPLEVLRSLLPQSTADPSSTPGAGA